MQFLSGAGLFSRCSSVLIGLTALLFLTASASAETRTATVAVRAGLEIYATGPHGGVVWTDGLGRVYADCHDPKDTRNINYACSGQINPKLQANEIITSSSIKGLTLTAEIKACPATADHGSPPFTNQQCVAACSVGQYQRAGSDNACYPIKVMVSMPKAGISKKSFFPVSADINMLPARLGCDMFELKRASVANGGVKLLSANLTNTPETGCSVVLELSKPTNVQQPSNFIIEVGAKGVTKTHVLSLNLVIPVL